jgi:hypothetical protein
MRQKQAIKRSEKASARLGDAKRCAEASPSASSQREPSDVNQTDSARIRFFLPQDQPTPRILGFEVLL